MPSVTSASWEPSRPLVSRTISARGCGISLKCFCPGSGSGFGEPCMKTARMPDWNNASMLPSVCAGVGLLWHREIDDPAPPLRAALETSVHEFVVGPLPKQLLAGIRDHQPDAMTDDVVVAELLVGAAPRRGRCLRPVAGEHLAGNLPDFF